MTITIKCNKCGSHIDENVYVHFYGKHFHVECYLESFKKGVLLKQQLSKEKQEK